MPTIIWLKKPTKKNLISDVLRYESDKTYLNNDCFADSFVYLFCKYFVLEISNCNVILYEFNFNVLTLHVQPIKAEMLRIKCHRKVTENGHDSFSKQ